MDQLSVNQPYQPAKIKRRKHSPEFRAKIVALSQQPGASIAAIAQAHHLNANLVHKWRRKAEEASLRSADPSAFVALPLPTPSKASPSNAESHAQTVHLQWRDLSVDWPLTHIDQALPWLKALGV